MNEHAALAALLRTDLRFFVWKCVQTIAPGTPYLRNWHVDATAHQLMRIVYMPATSIASSSTNHRGR